MMKGVLFMAVLFVATACMVFLPAAPARAANPEHVVLDITREYDTGLTGFSTDDTYAVAGHITRVDVSYEFKGWNSGGANEVLPRQAGQIKVHRYLDCFSHLKVHIVAYAD